MLQSHSQPFGLRVTWYFQISLTSGTIVSMQPRPGWSEIQSRASMRASKSAGYPCRLELASCGPAPAGDQRLREAIEQVAEALPGLPGRVVARDIPAVAGVVGPGQLDLTAVVRQDPPAAGPQQHDGWDAIGQGQRRPRARVPGTRPSRPPPDRPGWKGSRPRVRDPRSGGGSIVPSRGTEPRKAPGTGSSGPGAVGLLQRREALEVIALGGGEGVDAPGRPRGRGGAEHQLEFKRRLLVHGPGQVPADLQGLRKSGSSMPWRSGSLAQPIFLWNISICDEACLPRMTSFNPDGTSERSSPGGPPPGGPRSGSHPRSRQRRK